MGEFRSITTLTTCLIQFCPEFVLCFHVHKLTINLFFFFHLLIQIQKEKNMPSCLHLSKIVSANDESKLSFDNKEQA